jgi:2-polyprenyl-3-methyl-5-hydroxy-6-metoxy-1,4-benzoquinol methylase
MSRPTASATGRIVALSSGRIRDDVTHQAAGQADRQTNDRYVGKRLKQIRVGKILNALDLDPASVLDAGTEDVTFVYWLADGYKHATVTGIDIDESAIDTCQRARPVAYAGRVNFEARSSHDLPP